MRVVLADDAVLFRRGLARLLTDAGIEVVGEVSDVTNLTDVVTRLNPDVLVVDVRMPPTHTTEGLVAAVDIRRARPGQAVLVLSQHVEAHYVTELLGDRPEGLGYLLKERVADDVELLDAVRRVAAGGSVIDPYVVSAILAAQSARDPVNALTPREREVLALMAEGRSNSAICARLFLTDKTVESHVRSIFQRLDLPAAADENRRVLAVLAHLRSPGSTATSA
ncbi:MAG: response regulator transcription factor [Pseudolysinimonas sp.]